MRKTDDQGRFTFHVPPGRAVSSTLRMAVRTIAWPTGTSGVPEQGEIEPVRLMRRPAGNQDMMTDIRKAAAPDVKKAAAPRPIEPDEGGSGRGRREVESRNEAAEGPTGDGARQLPRIESSPGPSSAMGIGDVTG